MNKFADAWRLVKIIELDRIPVKEKISRLEKFLADNEEVIDDRTREFIKREIEYRKDFCGGD